MTQNTFKGTVSANFATPGDWSLGHVPNDTEDALIAPTGAFNIAVESNTELVNSIGTLVGDGLVIDDSASLFAFDGTGPNANDGSISVVNADLFLNNGTFDNPGTLALDGVESSDVASLLITGSIDLDGGGNVEMAIGAQGQAGPGDNLIEGDNVSTTPTLFNVNDTISGEGTIGGLVFINDGTIETNNSSSANGGFIAIQGSAGGGSFDNDTGGLLAINSGGAVLFGENNKVSTIDNEGVIVFQADLKFTQLFVTGNVAISASGGGHIEMEGETPNDNEIDDLGETTSLTLINQTLDGAGTIGIGDKTLTVNLESGAIEADLPNQVLLINTGSNTVLNGGTLQAFRGGELVIDSPINNLGTINVSQAGSIVDFFGAVTGGGVVDIGQNGILVANSTISGNVTFTGTGADLEIRNNLANAGIGGQIAGAVATDELDVTTVGFASGVHAVWQQTSSSAGTLSLYKNGVVVNSFNLTGQFNPLDFVVSNDGFGGSLITVQTTPGFAENSGNNDEWIMANGQWDGSAGPGSHPSGYNVAGTGDWTGNGTDGILWFNPSNGDADEWQLSNTQWSASVDLGTHPGGYQISGVGDFNGDGTSDVLWTTASGGSVQTDIWELGSNGKWAASVSPGSHPAGYNVAGIGDWTGSGTDGILWYDASNGATDEWQLSGGKWAASVDLGSHPTNATDGAGYQIAGVGDFFDNGRDGILWTSVNANGTVATDIWELGSAGQWIASTSPGNHPAGYSVVGVGDFTGTGTSDILWYNASTGDADEWLINNGQWAGSIDLGTHPGNFQIAGVGDFNGDGTKDILWHSPT